MQNAESCSVSFEVAATRGSILFAAERSDDRENRCRYRTPADKRLTLLKLKNLIDNLRVFEGSYVILQVATLKRTYYKRKLRECVKCSESCVTKRQDTEKTRKSCISPRYTYGSVTKACMGIGSCESRLRLLSSRLKDSLPTKAAH